jgi:hypothetical protein
VTLADLLFPTIISSKLEQLKIEKLIIPLVSNAVFFIQSVILQSLHELKDVERHCKNPLREEITWNP